MDGPHPTYRPRHPVAYVTVPGEDAAGSVGRAWQPAAGVAWAARHGPARPHVGGALRAVDNPERPAGWVLTLPVTPAEVRAGSRRARLAAWRAVERARALGVRTVGVHAGVLALLRAHAPALPDDVGFSTAAAFQAALCVMQVRRLRAHAAGRPVALLGVDRPEGHAVARVLAADGGPLRLAGRDRAALHALCAEAGGDVRVISAAGCAPAGVVVVLRPLDVSRLAPRLGPDAIVLDAARSVAPGLLLDRPDVRVVDRGLVAVPGVTCAEVPAGRAPVTSAGVAGALLLGLTGHHGDFALDGPGPQDVATMLAAAARFARLGFTPAAPQSFGQPVSLTRRFERDAPVTPAPRRAEGWPGVSPAGFPAVSR